MVKKIIIFVILNLLFCQSVFAADYLSDVYIENNVDAVTQCLITCEQHKANWTGNWWSPSERNSVCECFYAWPYCPQINNGPPQRGCVFQSGTVYTDSNNY